MTGKEAAVILAIASGWFWGYNEHVRVKMYQDELLGKDQLCKTEVLMAQHSLHLDYLLAAVKRLDGQFPDLSEDVSETSP